MSHHAAQVLFDLGFSLVVLCLVGLLFYEATLGGPDDEG
jgi:hypothetical protein